MDETLSSLRNGLDCFLTATWNIYEEPQISSIASAKGPLRVGIIGAHGTGKTTLAKLLAQALELPYIEEVARTVNSLGFKLDQQADIKTQVMIWLGQLWEELAATEFITDRTLLDVIAYCRMLQHHWPEQDHYMVTALTNLTYQMLNQYSHLIYVPIEFAVEDDGIRDTNESYRQQVDQTFRELLESSPVEWFRVSGTREQRLKMCLDWLKA